MQPLGGFANLTAHQLSELTGASVPTVRRWKRFNRAPIIVVRYLTLKFRGELSLIHPHWDGWTLRRDGKLHSPEGHSFTFGEVRAIPLQYGQIRELQGELRSAREVRDQQAHRDAGADGHQPVRARRQPRRGRGDRLKNLIRRAVHDSLTEFGASLSRPSSSASAARPAPAAQPAPLRIRARVRSAEPASLTTSP